MLPQFEWLRLRGDTKMITQEGNKVFLNGELLADCVSEDVAFKTCFMLNHGGLYDLNHMTEEEMTHVDSVEQFFSPR